MDKVKELQHISQRIHSLKETRKNLVDKKFSKYSSKTNHVRISNGDGHMLYNSMIDFNVLMNMIDSQIVIDREKYQKLVSELFEEKGEI